jgi:hypothetical protein
MSVKLVFITQATAGGDGVPSFPISITQPLPSHPPNFKGMLFKRKINFKFNLKAPLFSFQIAFKGMLVKGIIQTGLDQYLLY